MGQHRGSCQVSSDILLTNSLILPSPRNVLYYAQGALTRWRTVPGAPDLLWFEGGGDAAIVDSRSREPAWVFPDFPDISISTSSLSPPDSTHHSSFRPQQPLTTLLYLFNTLDVELVHAPSLEHVWPRVEALYVHGLRLHVRTGAGMAVGRDAVLDVGTRAAKDPSAAMHNHTEVNQHCSLPQSQLGTRLKRCYVIVGSWGTPLRNPGRGENPIAEIGVRHVDFVREAWSRWKSKDHKRSKVAGSGKPSGGVGSPVPSPSSRPSFMPCDASPIPSLLNVDTSFRSQAYITSTSPVSPLVFRSSRVRSSRSSNHRLQSGGGWDSDYDGDSEFVYSEWDESESEYEYSHEQATSADDPGSPLDTLFPFHTRIPQLAWSSTLRSGRGGYYISKTVEESAAVWRARKGGHVDASEGDMSASDEECSSEEREKRVEAVSKRRPHHLLACDVEKESEPRRAVGFWRRFARAGRGPEDQVGRLGVSRDAHGLTKAKTKTMSHIRKAVKHVHVPVFTDESMRTVPHVTHQDSQHSNCKTHAAYSSPSTKSMIASFFGTPSERGAFDWVCSLSESSNSPQSSSNCSSATATSTSQSSTSSSFIPVSATVPIKFPSQSSLTDEPVKVHSDVDPSNHRRTLKGFRSSAKKDFQEKNKLDERPWLRRAQSVSALLQRGRKTSTAHEQHERPLALPTHTHPYNTTASFPADFPVHPTKGKRVRRHSHGRASAAHGFRLDPDPPPVPPLPLPLLQNWVV